MQQQITELLGRISTGGASNLEIKQASNDLQTLFQSPESVASLLHVIATNEHVPVFLLRQIRQLSAIELRKLVQKQQNWEGLQDAQREEIKFKLLEIAVLEPNSLVRQSLSHLIAEVARKELEAGRWKDILNTLVGYCANGSPQHKELGISVLYSLFDYIPDDLYDHLGQFMQLFSTTINDSNLFVQVTSIQALGKLAEMIDETDAAAISAFQNLVPFIVQVLQKCLASGNDSGVLNIIEVFDALLVLETPLISRNFGDLVRLFLDISKNGNNSDEIRTSSLSFILWWLITHKSMLGKLGIVLEIVQTMFIIGSEEETDDESDNPVKLAFQVINSLGTNLPPNKVFPHVIQTAVQYMQSPNPGQRKAAMLSIAVLCEGCADFMRTHLPDMIQAISTSMRDSDPVVRKAGCMAFGAMCDHFEDDVADYHDTILPILFTLIQDSDRKVVMEALTTIDVLLELLTGRIEPYMQLIMETLVLLLDTPDPKFKALVTNCIGSAAHAAGRLFTPYFTGVIDRLGVLMTLTSPADFEIRGVVTDCMGALCTAVGKEVFRPYLPTIMNQALQGMQLDKQRLNRCAYVLFGVLAREFEEEFACYLEVVVPPLLEACSAPERDFTQEPPQEESEEQNVTSDIANEKECSIETLGDLFAATKSAFMPYFERSLNTGLLLLDHFHEGVRRASVSALFKFLSTVYTMAHGDGDWTPGVRNLVLHENVQTVATLVMNCVFMMLADEEDSEVSDLLKMIGPAAVSQKSEPDSRLQVQRQPDMLANQISLILQDQHPCQCIDVDTAATDEEEMAELDALVISNAADAIASLSQALGPEFAEYFETFFKLLGKYFKASRSVSDRSMAVGSVAEFCQGLEQALTPYTEPLLEMFAKAISDPEEEVQSNGCFGLGLVCYFSQIDLSAHYQQLLDLVSAKFQGPASTLRDNACGAVARMALKNSGMVQQRHIQGMLASIPLQHDLNENRVVYKAIGQLLEQGLECTQQVRQVVQNAVEARLSDEETIALLRQYL